METRMPIASVSAKPRTNPVPNWNRIKLVIKLEILESRIEVHALAKPASIAKTRFFPQRISSFIRSNIKMLASTAMPIERINPAIPASVRVIGMSLKMSYSGMLWIILAYWLIFH
jgi:hypothetical protein